jgi:Xaa-Pro aminopeptidase
VIADRQERLLAAMAERGLDAMLVTDLVNVRYLTGYVGTNGAAVLAPDRRVLLTDSRYLVRARAETSGVEVQPAGRDLLGGAAAVLAGVGGRVGVEADHVTLSTHARLLEALPGVELVPVSGMVEDLRVRKEPEEVELMRRAAEIADEALETLSREPIVGRPEAEVAWALESALRARGAEAASFPIIVAGAANGAEPHHASGRDPVPPDTLVVVDLGAVVGGYASDCTRTFATGPLPEPLERAYAVCLDAQAAALAAVRPGIGAAELDGVARELITEAGFGDAFGHGLGHGVGLEIHERPWVRREGDGTLEAGMMVTIEPGIYLDGLGGVRIEDLVLVTEDGGVPLGRFPKTLMTLPAGRGRGG